MSSLSLAMIVKDEATRLGRCLDSVQGLVDEMVVLDTGSSDQTPELARSKGAKVHFQAWTDDFSAARNACLGYCQGDWVLILDADETVDASDHRLIRSAIEQTQIPAYRLILRNYFPGGGETIQGGAPRVNDTAYKEGAEFPRFADGVAVRLCRLLPGLHFTGRIHELLEPYFQHQGLEVRDLNAVIHHFGKTDQAREAVKRKYYLDLALLDAGKDPVDLQVQFNILQQALAAEAWDIALGAAKACLRLAGSDPIHPLILLGTGMALQAHGRHEEALPYLERLQREHPDHSQGLTRLAVTLAALGRLEDARRSLRQAMLAQPGFIVPYVNLAELESQTGHYQEARIALTEGLEANPEDPQLLHALVQLGVAHGDLASALRDAWMAIQRCPKGGRGAWHRLVAFGHLNQGERTRAIEVLDLGLSEFPGQEDLLRLRALAEESKGPDPSSI